MVLMAIITTFITTPAVMAVYKPAKRKVKTDYGHRTVEREDPKSELRLLICFHSGRNIPSLLNLVEASRGTGKKQSLCLYALHLMELTERSSAMLMVHKARKNGVPFWNKARRSETNQIEVAFEAYEQLSRVSIRPMTAISAMSNIHEDICESAERKRAAMIIIPFHKHQRLDGSLETTRSEYRAVNRRVLANAPCSVGILVDRGLGGTTHVAASNVSSSMTVLFFGGPDDEEALAYGLRMAEHPGISLTIVYFLVDTSEHGDIVSVDINEETSSKNKGLLGDEKFLTRVKQNVSENKSVKFEERRVKNCEQVMEVAREYNKCNLYLVGRKPEGEVAIALKNNNNNNHGKGEYPELGPICNLLTSSEFSTSASVLVVQQYQGQKDVNRAHSSFASSRVVSISPNSEDKDKDSGK